MDTNFLEGNSAKNRIAAFVVLMAILILSTAIRLNFFYASADIDPKDDTCLFFTESVMQYHHARLIAEGKSIPWKDTAMQYPEGLYSFKDLTIFMELVYGGIYRLLGPLIDVPFHIYLIFMICLWSSLAVYPVYLLSREMDLKRIFSVAAALFYVLCYASFWRLFIAFNKEDFSIPLIFFSLYFFIRSFKSEKLSGSVSNALYSGLFLIASYLNWHLTQFYFMGLIALSAFLLFTDYNHYRKKLLLYLLCITPMLVLLGLLHPAYQSNLILLSPVMLFTFSLLLFLSIFKQGKSLKAAGFFVLMYLVVMALNQIFLRSGKSLHEYSHVYSLVFDKIRFFLEKPADPSLISYETRVMWQGDFLSPTLEIFAFLYVPSILPGLYALIRHGYEIIKFKKYDFIPLFIFLFTSAFFLQFILFRRLTVFLTPVICVYIALFFKNIAEKVNYKKLAAFLVIVFILLDILKLSVLKSQINSPALFKHMKEAVLWIRDNTSAKDVFAARFEYSPSIMVYANRKIVVHPKWETKILRDKEKAFTVKMFTDEKTFYSLLKGWGCTYFLFDNTTVISNSRYAPRYFADKLQVPEDSIAYKLFTRSKDVKHFKLVYENPTFRLYKLL